MAVRKRSYKKRNYNRARTSKRPSSRRRTSTRRSATQTIRIVLEQPSENSRFPTGMKAAPKIRRHAKL